MEFRAKEVFAGYDDNDVLIIGFSDNSDESHESIYFMIQAADVYDEQDRESGMDIYYIEKNNPSTGGYGGIKSLSLDRTRIVIEFDEKGYQHTKEEVIAIDFDCGSDEYENLRQRLRQVFSKSENSSDIYL